MPKKLLRKLHRILHRTGNPSAAPLSTDVQKSSLFIIANIPESNAPVIAPIAAPYTAPQNIVPYKTDMQPLVHIASTNKIAITNAPIINFSHQAEVFHHANAFSHQVFSLTLVNGVNCTSLSIVTL